MIQIWAFPADPLYCERLNPAERVNDIRHPINLRLFDWRVPALVTSGASQDLLDNILVNRIISVLQVQVHIATFTLLCHVPCPGVQAVEQSPQKSK